MSDIVERLLADGERQSEREARILVWRVLEDAATEIERLREALRVIEAYSDCHENARNIARAARGEDKPFEDRWDNA
jgi:hypothetical protein